MQNSKAWLTTGIKTSCNNKRKLYLLYRETNDPNKPKTTWGIIKTITNNKTNPNNISMIELMEGSQHITKPVQKNLIIIMFLLPKTLLIIIL
jgi:hypothetical protein